MAFFGESHFRLNRWEFCLHIVTLVSLTKTNRPCFWLRMIQSRCIPARRAHSFLCHDPGVRTQTRSSGKGCGNGHRLSHLVLISVFALSSHGNGQHELNHYFPDDVFCIISIIFPVVLKQTTARPGGVFFS